MEEEELCHNVKITYLQEEKQFINRTIHTKIWVIIEILITYYSTINYDFTLTEALSFLLKLSLDIVIPFLQSVFFQSQQAMILQRFFHCCNAEKKNGGIDGVFSDSSYQWLSCSENISYSRDVKCWIHHKLHFSPQIWLKLATQAPSSIILLMRRPKS